MIPVNVAYPRRVRESQNENKDESDADSNMESDDCDSLFVDNSEEEKETETIGEIINNTFPKIVGRCFLSFSDYYEQAIRFNSSSNSFELNKQCDLKSYKKIQFPKFKLDQQNNNSNAKICSFDIDSIVASFGSISDLDDTMCDYKFQLDNIYVNKLSKRLKLKDLEDGSFIHEHQNIFLGTLVMQGNCELDLHIYNSTKDYQVDWELEFLIPFFQCLSECANYNSVLNSIGTTFYRDLRIFYDKSNKGNVYYIPNKVFVLTIRKIAEILNNNNNFVLKVLIQAHNLKKKNNLRFNNYESLAAKLDWFSCSIGRIAYIIVDVGTTWVPNNDNNDGLLVINPLFNKLYLKGYETKYFPYFGLRDTFGFKATNKVNQSLSNNNAWMKVKGYYPFLQYIENNNQGNLLSRMENITFEHVLYNIPILKEYVEQYDNGDVRVNLNKAILSQRKIRNDIAAFDEIIDCHKHEFENRSHCNIEYRIEFTFQLPVDENITIKLMEELNSLSKVLLNKQKVEYDLFDLISSNKVMNLQVAVINTFKGMFNEIVNNNNISHLIKNIPKFSFIEDGLKFYFYNGMFEKQFSLLRCYNGNALKNYVKHTGRFPFFEIIRVFERNNLEKCFFISNTSEKHMFYHLAHHLFNQLFKSKAYQFECLAYCEIQVIKILDNGTRIDRNELRNQLISNIVLLWKAFMFEQLKNNGWFENEDRIMFEGAYHIIDENSNANVFRITGANNTLFKMVLEKYGRTRVNNELLTIKLNEFVKNCFHNKFIQLYNINGKRMIPIFIYYLDKVLIRFPDLFSSLSNLQIEIYRALRDDHVAIVNKYTDRQVMVEPKTLIPFYRIELEDDVSLSSCSSEYSESNVIEGGVLESKNMDVEDLDENIFIQSTSWGIKDVCPLGEFDDGDLEEIKKIKTATIGKSPSYTMIETALIVMAKQAEVSWSNMCNIRNVGFVFKSTNNTFTIARTTTSMQSRMKLLNRTPGKLDEVAQFVEENKEEILIRKVAFIKYGISYQEKELTEDDRRDIESELGLL